MLRAMGAGDVKLMSSPRRDGRMAEIGSAFLSSRAIIGGFASLALVTLRGRVKKTLWNVGFVLSEMKSGRAAYLAYARRTQTCAARRLADCRARSGDSRRRRSCLLR